MLDDRDITCTEIEMAKSGQWVNLAAYLATLTEVVTETTVSEVVPEDSSESQQEEKEHTMTLDLQQMDFFRDALRSEKRTKLDSLERTFGQTDDEAPHTAEEIAARITAGKFILRDKSYRSYGSRLDRFIWRDPAVKQDDAGFNAAVAKLKEAYKLAKFAIMTAPADGAKAVTDFAALSFA